MTKMTNTNLDNILDERTRIKTVVLKFQPTDFTWNGVDPKVSAEGQIATLALSQFTEDQKAIAYGSLAEEYLARAKRLQNPDYSVEAFKISLSHYLDSLRCMKAISPQLRPVYLEGLIHEVETLKDFEMPDQTLWAALSSKNECKYRALSEYLKEIISELTSTTPIERRLPQLRDADYFKTLEETKRKYLLSADAIALSEDWETEDFDRYPGKDIDRQKRKSQAAMAFLYQQAGETHLAKVLQDWDAWRGKYRRDRKYEIDKIRDVVQIGDSFHILFKPVSQRFRLTHGKAKKENEKKKEEERNRKEPIIVGLNKEKTERLGYVRNGFYPVDAMSLQEPSDPLNWMTSAEVFKKSAEEQVQMYGVPANIGVYRLVNQEPVFNLLNREGNLLLSPQFRELFSYRLKRHGRDRCIDSIVASKDLIISEAEREYVLAAINEGKSAEATYSNIRLGGGKSLNAHDKNTPDEKRLFLQAFGTQSPENGSSITLLDADQIKSALQQRPHDIIAMACYVNTADDFDRFLKGKNKASGFLAANNDFVYWTWVPG